MSSGQEMRGDSDSSSVEGSLPPRKRSQVHRIISCSSSSDTDDDKPLYKWVGGGNKYTVGIRLRKIGEIIHIVTVRL